MTAGKQVRFYALIFLVATAALEIGKSQARAQIGFGFDLFRPVPSPTQFINDHALTRAAAGQKRRLETSTPTMQTLTSTGFAITDSVRTMVRNLAGRRDMRSPADEPRA